jgi:integrase/recombinase XerD
MICGYDNDLQALVRSIKGATYSGTNKFWYVEESEEKLREIIKVFRGKADIDISAISVSGTDEIALPANDETPGSKPLADKPEDQDIPHTTMQIIGETDEEVEIRGSSKAGSTKYGPVEFRINEKDGRLIIRFTGNYDRSWIEEIRSYGKFYYDKQHREFLLPWSKLKTDSLSDYFSLRKIEVRVIRQKVPAELKSERLSSGTEVRSRYLNNSAREGLEALRRNLEENRYSYRTIETYTTLLELFFKYFNAKDPEEISQNDVSDFMNDYIIKNGFSGSYQNQMVSAIKLYYEITGKGKVIPQILDRPRRGRTLPKVFSKEEVERILNSARNQKHKLLLWMIYSCGLRRSEVTNVKLTDMDRDRNLLHIREGKGNVDRVVPVSEKVWQKIDEYMKSYNPGIYLFEGQNGGRYSSESVYNVFRQALLRAGIKKEVGVHSLRHSYATHLHENGLDIRYIQELLGHKSTRTTEIYTHVSRRNLVAVRSPIDDIDVK